MTIDEAIKHCEEKEREQALNGCFACAEEHKQLAEVLKELKTLKERPQGEWIPVSERLPERHKAVIITDIETSDTYQSQYIGNGYWECDNGTFKNRIIAWMPLPEPYKETKND